MLETNRKTGRDPQSPRSTHAWWHSRWFKWVAGLTVVAFLMLTIVATYLARNAEPLLRTRLVETISARFNSPVELDSLHISVVKGIVVEGAGLRILYLAGPTQPDASPHPAPMLNVKHFSFDARLTDLLHLRSHIGTIHVQDVEVHIPPAGERTGLFGPSADLKQPKPPTEPAIALLIDHILCDNVKLFIETSKPGKDPLEFDIQNISLTKVASNEQFLYVADLTNPKPTGQIHAFGHFGPWQPVEPRTTPLDGDYRFDHADLSSIKGLGGTLSSVGHFTGQLGQLVVDGTSETPNFSLDISNHPVPLHTQFHALVDGTTGDTTLAPVSARLLHTNFTAQGAVMRVHGKGHDITLSVNIPDGRIEDLLQLGMKTEPPVIRGNVAMKARLHVPPGPQRVALKLQLEGDTKIQNVSFGNPKVQDKVNSLSMRAQGQPELARAAASDHIPEVKSQMSTSFSLANGLMTVSSIHYQIPGALVLLDGVYSMDGNVFEFKGHVRTDATASQMVTGWKSILLMPFDKFLKKNGAGLELPISVSGAKSDLHIGLATDAGESPQAMAADLKSKRAAAPSGQRPMDMHPMK